MNTLEAFVQVWSFKEAPAELQKLSTHGGDEDYVVLVDTISGSSNEGDSLGEDVAASFTVCDVECHQDITYNGRTVTVWITAHA